MKKNILLVLIIGSLGFVSAFAEDGHDHANHKQKEEHEKHKKSEGHDDHGEEGHDDHGEEGHDDHGEEGHDDHGDGAKTVGKGKAITAVDKVKGFKLSKEAIKSLEIKLKTVEGSIFKITKKMLVSSKNKIGVYRFRGGFFKLLDAKILKEIKGGYKVEVKGVDFGDQIVINGTGLLRVTDVYSTDKSNYGHSH